MLCGAVLLSIREEGDPLCWYINVAFHLVTSHALSTCLPLLSFLFADLYLSPISPSGQQEHIRSEKLCMDSVDSPFLIQLFGSFQDHDAVHLLFEPALGGELFSLLRAKTMFTEDVAKYYAACVGMLDGD